MTRAETLAVMSILKAAYPAFYRDMKRQDAEAAVNLWAEMFEDYPPQVVAAAVKAHIASDKKGFPPCIGSIIDAINTVSAPSGEMSEGEAWAMVSKAIRNSGYNSEQEFEQLPERLQRIVGHPAQLREWALMDTSTVQSVVQSNIMRSFRARAESERKMRAMPSDVRSKMEELTKAAVKELPSYDMDLAQRMMDYNSGDG